MYVVQLFHPLLQTPDIEVIKPSLPESRLSVVGTFKAQVQLSSDRPLFGLQSARDALFQDLNRNGRSSLGWLTHQQMNVIWHDNISDKEEPVAVADLAQNLDKNIPSAN